ncbi:hypothetical protein OFEAOIEE_LOCUS3857 [Methylorubrum extorquens]
MLGLAGTRGVVLTRQGKSLGGARRMTWSGLWRERHRCRTMAAQMPELALVAKPKVHALPADVCARHLVILQLGTKSWVDIPDLTTAFMVTIVLHGKAPGFCRAQIMKDFEAAKKRRDEQQPKERLLGITRDDRDRACLADPPRPRPQSGCAHFERSLALLRSRWPKPHARPVLTQGAARFGRRKPCPCRARRAALPHGKAPNGGAHVPFSASGP